MGSDISGLNIQAFNIVLIVLFCLIILGLVIGLIIGYVRGIWKASFFLLWHTALVITAFFTLAPMIEAVGKIDLSQYELYINIAAEGGGAFSIQVTTILETIQNTIAAYLHLYNVQGTTIEIAAVAADLAVMFLKYAVFILDIVFIATMGEFIGWLLWVCCFKYIVPKIVRKQFRLRIVSMLEQGIMVTVIGALFISPFSSIVNIVNNAWKNNEHDLSNETINSINDFMQTYDQSVLSKVLFNWKTNEDGLTLDSALIDTATKTTIDGVSTSFIDMLNGLTNAGGALADALLTGQDGSPVNVGLLLSEKTLTNLFKGLNESQIFAYMLPLAATLALNSEQVKAYVDPALIDLSKEEWASQIEYVERMVLDIKKSGTLDLFLDENGQPIQNDLKSQETIKKFVNTMLDEKAYKYYTRIFNTINESKLLRLAVPCLMLHIGQFAPQISDLLPQTWEELSLINWGTELNIVYDNLYRLNRKSPELVDKLITIKSDGVAPQAPKSILYTADEPGATEPTPDTGNGEAGSEPKPLVDAETLNLIIDNIGAFASAMIGEFDENGKLINVDPQTGYTITKDSTGKPIRNAHYTLLDSTLFKNMMPGVFNALLQTLQSNEAFKALDSEKLTATIKGLSKGAPVKNYKEELAAIFTTLKAVATNNDVKDLILKGADPTKITLMLNDSKFVDSLATIIPTFGYSKIFDNLVRPLMSNLLSQDQVKPILEQIGIKPEDIENGINNTSDFYGEITRLLRTMPKISKVSTLLDGGSTTSQLLDSLSGNIADVVSVLDVVYESDIINPKTNRNNLNNNFFKVIEKIVGTESTPGTINMGLKLNFAQLQKDGKLNKDLNPVVNGHAGKWTNTKDSNGDFIRDAKGRPIFDGETGYIANILTGIGRKLNSGVYKDKSLASLFLEGNREDVTKAIGYLESDFKISSIFEDVNNSTILSSVFGQFLDNSLPPEIIIKGISSFSNVENWAHEGKIFGQICDTIKETELNINNIDLNSLLTKPNECNKLFHSLGNSQIFENSDGKTVYYGFNAFLYKMLDENLNNEIDLFADQFGTTHNRAMKDFNVDKIVNGKEISYVSTLPLDRKEEWVVPNWDATLDLDYKADYISNICGLLNYVNIAKAESGQTGSDINIQNVLKSGKISEATMSNMLLSAFDCKPLRIVLYNLLNNVGTVDVAGYNLKEINSGFILDEAISEDIKRNDIKLLSNIYHELTDLTKDPSLDGKNKEEVLQSILNKPESFIRLNGVLSNLNKTYMFHRAGPAQYNAKGDKYENTSFQVMLDKFVLSDPIVKFLYNEDSPKDKFNVANNVYHNGMEKATLLLNKTFDYNAANFDNQLEEISNIIEIISTFLGGPKDIFDYQYYQEQIYDKADVEHNTPIAPASLTKYEPLKDKSTHLPTLDLDYVDYNSVQGSKIKEIFENINNSDLLYDMVPNGLYTVFHSFGNNQLAEPLSYADPFYVYYINGSKPDFNTRYCQPENEDSSEFQIIADIIQRYQDIPDKDHMLDSGLDGNFLQTTLKGLLTDLHGSYLFHKGKLINKTEDELSFTARSSHMTTFETLLENFFTASKLNEYLPDQNAKERIINLTKEDEIAKGIYKDTIWANEIENLCSIGGPMSSLGVTNMNDISSIDITADTKFTPLNIKNLMVALNKSRLCEGCVGQFSKVMFEKAKLLELTSYMDESNTQQYAANFVLKTTGSQNPYEAEIENIYQFMNGLSYDHNETNGTCKYFVLAGGTGGQDPISNFISNGPGSKIILDYIHNSAYFNSEVEVYGIANDKINCESIFIYNLLKKPGLISFISGDNPMQTIDYIICDLGLYDSNIEAKALDVLVQLSKSFVGKKTVSQFDHLQDKGQDIYTIIGALEYDVIKNSSTASYPFTVDVDSPFGPGKRAYLCSEIISEILGRFMDNEIDNIKSLIQPGKAYAGSTFDDSLAIKFHCKPSATKYDILNITEAGAIKRMLEVTSINKENPTYLEYINYFKNQGTSLWKTMEYPDGKNSYFAAVLYTSRINPLIKEHVDSVAGIPGLGETAKPWKLEVNDLLLAAKDSTLGKRFTEYGANFTLKSA